MTIIRKSVLTGVATAVVLAITAYTGQSQLPEHNQAAAQVSSAKPAASVFYPVIREAAQLAGYTAYAPVGVKASTKLPVVVWGNGGCRLSNEEFVTFLTEIAAHGFYVIAVGSFDARYETSNGETETATILTKAVDWVAKGNQTGGSSVPNRLDASKIAVMGESCGGVESLQAGADPNVKSVVGWNGSTGSASVDVLALQALHTPTMWVTGGMTDPAYPAAHADYLAVSSTIPAVLANNSAAGHTGIYHGNNDPTAAETGAPVLGQEIEVQGSGLAVAWLNWTLNKQTSASTYFLGSDCTNFCGRTGQSPSFVHTALSV